MANNKWMTTFVYQQELKSYYMNNILYSVVRPGIFNAGIGLSIYSNRLKLRISKGTTFIFSNDYVGASDASSENGYCYRRSFNTRNFVEGSGLKTDSVYLIKCTALDDEEYNFDIPDMSNASSTSFYYITAFFKYDPNRSNTDITPTFKLFRNGADNEAYFVSVDGRTSLVEGLGDVSDAKDSINRSFLHLGAVKFSSTGNVKHIDAFTSRGLPEHRFNLVSDKMSMNPDIIYDIKEGIGNSIYVDLRNILHKGGIYSIDTDWEKLYGIRGYSSYGNESLPNRINLKDIADGKRSIDVVLAVLPSTKNVEGCNKVDNIKLVSHSIDPDKFDISLPYESTMLDTSVDNIERLINVVRGYNFVPYAINKLRDDNVINPLTGDSVIPICIVFRNGNEINPSNVLSLMDLEYKACKVNTLSLDHDAYSIIPVIM